jgi:hypothetical protein
LSEVPFRPFGSDNPIATLLYDPGLISAGGALPSARRADHCHCPHPVSHSYTLVPTMTVIRQEDLIQSVADALQYISYYHPMDYITALGRAY